MKDDEQQQVRAFEAWYNDPARNDIYAFNAFSYSNSQIQTAWKSWRAGRREALEEAAKVCDEQVAVYDKELASLLSVAFYERAERNENYKDAAKNLAAAIRALIDKERP